MRDPPPRKKSTTSTTALESCLQSSSVCECASGTYKAEVRERQTAQAADPGDLVVLQVENGEAAAFLQACDLAEAVVWQWRRVKSTTSHATDQDFSFSLKNICRMHTIAYKDTSQIQFAEVQIGRQILHFCHAVVG